MAILGDGKKASVHVQVQDQAEVTAHVNVHTEPFMVIYLGDITVYVTLDAAGSLAEQLLRELSNESIRAAKAAEENSALAPIPELDR